VSAVPVYSEADVRAALTIHAVIDAVVMQPERFPG